MQSSHQIQEVSLSDLPMKNPPIEICQAPLVIEYGITLENLKRKNKDDAQESVGEFIRPVVIKLFEELSDRIIGVLIDQNYEDLVYMLKSPETLIESIIQTEKLFKEDEEIKSTQ